MTVDSVPPGRLFCLPTPLGPDADPVQTLPGPVLARIAELAHFVVESPRQARAFLKRVGTRLPLQALDLKELNEHTRPTELPALLAPLLAGHDLGLMSDAGCPGVADPGAALVALAHRAGVTVVPMVGPSSLLLALMASGMNGQRFAFAGYLPVPGDLRAQALRELERRSAREGETQLWIETPYRNEALLQQAIEVLQGDTELSVASELSLEGERIRRASVSQWRHQDLGLAKVPTVFALLASGRTAGARDRPRPGTPETSRGRPTPGAGRSDGDGRADRPRPPQGQRRRRP